jgi:hypothetical protein
MADKGTEQSGEHPPQPWWAGTGPRGAAWLIVIGLSVALLAYVAYATGRDWLPLVPAEPAVAYYQAAKIAVIGLVILVSLFLCRRRTRAEAGEQGRQAHDG